MATTTRDIPALAARPGFHDPSTELSARRTGMSFQRTRMSADRTLMSVIRTSLSLISVGFTIDQLFQKMQRVEVLHGGAHAARHFGGTLVVLGVGILGLGPGDHVLFMRGLRQERVRMRAEGLIHGESQFSVSLTAIVAVVLLVVALLAMFGLSFEVGPFT